MSEYRDYAMSVLRWCDGAWHVIDWDDWANFRATLVPFAPLSGVTAGEHHFVVCVVEENRLRNIIPHRYLIDRDGRIADDRYFGTLSDDEIVRYEVLEKRLNEPPYDVDSLSGDEWRELDMLRDRLWRSWLPSAEAIRALPGMTRAMPHENDAAWKVLETALHRGEKPQ